MHDDHLIRMANQIGDFFESMPDQAEARKGIATHLKKYWDPRMRKAFLAQVDGGAHNNDINAIVLAAASEHRALIG